MIDIEQEVTKLLQAGKFIEAVKLYRKQKNVGLKEAKEKVEEIAKRYNITPITSSKSSSTGCSAFVVVALIVAFIAGCILFGVRGLPVIIAKFNKNNKPVPGDPHRFDPVASLTAVAAFAGPDSQLVGFEARFVRSDGTMDLTADYNPEVKYSFQRIIQASDKNKPLGAGGGPGPRYVPVTVQVWKPGRIMFHHRIGGGVSSKWNEMERGMRREEGSEQVMPVGKPVTLRCSLEKLWQTAIQKGAPSDAVAAIRYDADWGYRFSIADTDVRLSFDDNCLLTIR